MIWGWLQVSHCIWILKWEPLNVDFIDKSAQLSICYTTSKASRIWVFEYHQPQVSKGITILQNVLSCLWDFIITPVTQGARTLIRWVTFELMVIKETMPSYHVDFFAEQDSITILQQIEGEPCTGLREPVLRLPMIPLGVNIIYPLKLPAFIHFGVYF